MDEGVNFWATIALFGSKCLQTDAFHRCCPLTGSIESSTSVRCIGGFIFLFIGWCSMSFFVWFFVGLFSTMILVLCTSSLSFIGCTVRGLGALDKKEIYHIIVSVTCVLAIGLPLSRTDTKRDGSCPSVSDGVDPPTFYTLCKRFSVFLSLSQSDFRSIGPLRIPDDPTQFGCIGDVWVYFPQWSLFCALAPSILLVVESETEAHLTKKKFTKFLLLSHVCYGI